MRKGLDAPIAHKADVLLRQQFVLLLVARGQHVDHIIQPGGADAA